ncbi:MAG: glycosyltransferase [Oceanospirillaceae bacterium]|nr:glycosyltransferase [Colwellia sp.]NQZ32163.1 glycosyltransferase [Oceanospirillaceae bacterium]
MSNYPKVAVLLAAYNGRDWIEEQINSILIQKNVNVTLYISVDLSTDDTYGFVSDLELINKYIKVLDYGKRFGSASSNFFRLIKEVDFSSYDYVSLSDQDDVWYDWKVHRAISKLNETNSSGYSSDVTAFWPDGKEQLLKKSYPQCEHDYFFESPGPGCTFVFKQSVLQAFKSNFDKISTYADQISVNHDWYLYAYVRQQGLNWIIDNRPAMMYRQHASNEMGMNSGLKSYSSRCKMVKNHWYRKQVAIMLESFEPQLKDKLLNRKYLILNFYKLRRRPRDRLALLIMLLIGFF